MGTVVLPCPGFFPLVSHSLLGPHQAYSHFSRPVVGFLTRDKVFIHSASRESRVMQRREGGGTDFGEGRGNHSGRKIVGNELFAYRPPPPPKFSPFNLVLKSLIVLPPAGPQREGLEMLLHF